MSAVREAAPVRVGPSVGKPSLLAVVLGILLTGLQVANQLVFANDPAIKAALAVAITFLGGVGISALFGPTLVAILHVSPKLLMVISAALTAANGVLAIVVISTAAHTIIAAVLTFVGVLFFGSSPVRPAVTEAVGRRRI